MSTYENYDKFWRQTVSELNRLHIRLDYATIQAAFIEITAHTLEHGKVVTTGLGKAGIAARKAAATFCSLGVPACYLDPSTAAHGDLGVIQPFDVVLAFTNSGKTREVLEMLARTTCTKIVITGSTKRIGDITISIGNVKEAGHLGLAPTTSFLAMCIVSDMIASEVSKAIGWTVTDFGSKHHAGYLALKCQKALKCKNRKPSKAK